MTREEAICELSVIWERLSHPEDCENGCYSFRDGDYTEALDMAIEALQTEAVRCKDCRHANECHKSVQYTHNEQSTITIGYTPIEWCSRGERKGGDSE